MADADRKLAAILSADVVGYSRLMAKDEDETVRRLGAYRTEITNVQETLRLEPSVSLAKVEDKLSAADPVYRARYVDGLRKAGMPEE